MTTRQTLAYTIPLLLTAAALAKVVMFILTGDARWLIPAALGALFLWRLIR